LAEEVSDQLRRLASLLASSQPLAWMWFPHCSHHLVAATTTSHHHLVTATTTSHHHFAHGVLSKPQ